MSRRQAILLVEDEPDIAAVMRLALEELGGYRVTVCGSGEAALEAFATQVPDLILLDVMLPDMDGPVLLARLRGRPGGATIPVVFVTARVRPAEQERLRALGALDVISKPFDPMTLAERLRALCADSER